MSLVLIPPMAVPFSFLWVQFVDFALIVKSVYITYVAIVIPFTSVCVVLQTVTVHCNIVGPSSNWNSF